MTQRRVHLRQNDPDGGRADVTLCGASSLTWTKDPQAVTCPACVGKMELQPS